MIVKEVRDGNVLVKMMSESGGRADGGLLLSFRIQDTSSALEMARENSVFQAVFLSSSSGKAWVNGTENGDLTVEEFVGGTSREAIHAPCGPVFQVELFLSGTESGTEQWRQEAYLEYNQTRNGERDHEILVFQLVSLGDKLDEVMKQFEHKFNERLCLCEKFPTGSRDQIYWPFATALTKAIHRSVPLIVTSPLGIPFTGSETIYKEFGLDASFPVLTSQYGTIDRFKREKGMTQLLSPHLCSQIKSHALGVDAKEATFRGDFRYFHYGQGGEDDRGWGCAYRSLQMVASWYYLSGFSEVKEPSIEGIQAILLGMGVMDQAFKIGCKQWIGSQEVSWVLNSLYNSESRFLFCKGSDINSLSRNLSDHFESVGSPVVACGANLALTILGVAWDSLTGECQYLIADPHYTGADMIEDVIAKSSSMEGGFRACGVSWRSTNNTFKGSAQYTFLLPQRPSK